jgi:hypothetical protein
VAASAKSVFARMQARFPSAIQMVYDNYNFRIKRPSSRTRLFLAGVGDFHDFHFLAAAVFVEF